MPNRIKGKTQSFNIRNIPTSEWNKLKIIHLREGLGRSLSEFCLDIIKNYMDEYIKKNQIVARPISDEEFDEMDNESSLDELD